ncbi:MAG: HD domain-containing protein [Terrimicrobiaceae bacterium]
MNCRIRGQVDEINKKESANGKPFWELKLRDASDALTLRAWADTAAFDSCGETDRGTPVEIEGEFLINGSFGLDGRRWRMRPLKPGEAQELFAGTPEAQAAVDRDFKYLQGVVEGLADPRLRSLGSLFLSEHGERFQRAAAARFNHHAHRGGLLRHTAQMMRAASALCDVYPHLNRDLLLSGVLFHDSGKLWEMCPPEQGFDMPREIRGELLGHISIGVELINSLWRKLPLEEWKSLPPASEDVRLHLLHLVAAHHGELQFGSPVEPKTPEAIMLHFVDNIDARIEMFAAAYEKQPEIAPGIHERVKALGTSPVCPLRVQAVSSAGLPPDASPKNPATSSASQPRTM